MVDIHLPDDWATADEKEKLKRLFDAENDAALNAALVKVCHAAMQEYKEMFLGQGVPTRAEEVKQRRLFLLTKHLFGGTMPSEYQVGDMFQLTENQSRALLRNVLSRFRYDIGEELKDTLRSCMDAASYDEDTSEYRVVIRSEVVLEEMRKMLEEEAPLLKPITKVPNTSRNYSISVDTLNALRVGLEMTPVDQPADQ